MDSKDFRLTGWFQTINDEVWDEDKLEAAIAQQLKPLGIAFQGISVFEVQMHRGLDV